MSKRDRARISRENGAKSKGPTTAEGKSISAQNARKSDEFAQKLACFVPPNPAVLCNEDREAFDALLATYTQIYQPVNQIAAEIVHEIAAARWQVQRLNHCLTMEWNLEILNSSTLPGTVAPELAELQTMGRSVRALYTSGAIAHRINRQVDQLELRAARLERRLKFVHANFPNTANAPKPEPAPAPETQINEPIMYVTENKPEVIRAYKQQFPNCKIELLPPDDVARGIYIEDDMLVAPRKVT